MSKKIFAALIVAVVATFAGYNIYQSQRAEMEMSDLAMANIEALANDGESSTETTWSCKGTVGTCGAKCGLCGTTIPKSKGTLTGGHKCSM